jgi:phage-related minor tail protein
MQSLILMLLLITSAASLCTSQQKKDARHADKQPGLDMRVRGLEEQLQNQQFEINQLKKELLARDEELHALTEMIEGDPNADQNAEQQNDDTFEVQSDACQETRFVHFSRHSHRPAKAKRISFTTIH